MIDVNAEILEGLWDGWDTIRTKQKTRVNYYDGKHSILGRKESYADGNPKSELVTNWVADIVDKYVGSLTSTPYQVSADGDDAETDGPETYRDISRRNALRAQDVKNLRNACLLGYGIGVHEFVDREIRIRSENPLEWVPVEDSRGELVGALNRVLLSEGTVHDGKILTEDREFMTWYDDKQIVTYQRVGGETFQEVENVSHNYGTPPVEVWYVDDDRRGIVSDALISQNDEYNDIDSLSGDDIDQAVDSILKFTGGLEDDWFNDNIATMLKKRSMNLPDEVDADFIARQIHTEAIKSRLDRTREHINIMGKVADTGQIVGATGSTSGIALKLKFEPMRQRATSMINLLEVGMRRRIELMNAVLRPQGKAIEDVTVTIQFSLPVNEIEQWAAVRSLDNLVSKLTQLELLDSVDDPQKELERMREEKLRAIDEEALPDEERAIAQDREVEKRSQVVESSVDMLLRAVEQGVIDTLNREGLIEKIANRFEKKNAEENKGEGNEGGQAA